MAPIEKLQTAMEYAMAHRPQVGGFPFLAECLRMAGVEHNLWSLPSAQSMYKIDGQWLVQQSTPLFTGLGVVPPFNQEALITALCTDQAGLLTFPEFLTASWQAGVVGYDVDFSNRTVTYVGSNGERYVEAYPAVEIQTLTF